MYCPHCGKQMDGSKRFCTACGEALPRPVYTKKRNMLGIVSFGISVAYAVIVICICVPVIMVQYDLFRQLGGPLFLEWLGAGIVPLVLSVLSTVAYRHREDYESGIVITLAGFIISWASFAACVGMACTMLFMLF